MTDLLVFCGAPVACCGRAIDTEMFPLAPVALRVHCAGGADVFGVLASTLLIAPSPRAVSCWDSFEMMALSVCCMGILFPAAAFAWPRSIFRVIFRNLPDPKRLASRK